MTRKIFTVGILGLLSTGLHAQLNSSVSVEGEYEPIVIETERINSFPTRYKYELPAASLNYDYQGITTDFQPDLLTMGVTGRQTAWPAKRPRGYADFNLGSFLNSHLDAGYYAIADSVNTLLADIKFRSSTLYRSKSRIADFTRLPLKRFYDGSFGLHYSRLIGAQGRLAASASYRAAYFNYYGTALPLASIAPEESCPIPTQTVNEASAAVSYSSSPSFTEGWHAGLDFNHLSMRRLYGQPMAGSFPSQKGDRETRLDIRGGYAFPIRDSNAFNVDIESSFLFYPEREPYVVSAVQSARKNYGVVTIVPSYRMTHNGLQLEAGLNLAASYDAMGKNAYDRFGGFHIAPAVDLSYRSKSGIGLFLSAKGGVTPVTLKTREGFDIYQMPWLLSTCPVYSPIDGRIGLTAGPFRGFSASLAFRYAVAKNTPLGGWYQAFLGSETVMPANSTAAYTKPYLQSLSLHGYGVTLECNYAYGKLVTVGFEGSFTPQNGKKGIFNGFDRPRWILKAKAGVSPIKRLNLEVEYEYRGVRNCYAMVSSASQTDLFAYRLPDLTLLKVRISYRILDNLEIYCIGNNLLNRRVDWLPGLQTEGMAFAGGVYVEF